MRIISAEENQRIAVGARPDALTANEITALLREWRRASGGDPGPFFQHGGTWIKPLGWSGMLATQDVAIEVVPKGSRSLSQPQRATLDRNVGQMVEVTLSGPDVALGDADLSTAGSVQDRAIDALCELILSARRNRKLRHYETRELQGTSLRGRLRFPDQGLLAVRRPGHFSQIWVELGEDLPVNRFLRGAMEHLSRRVSGRVRRRTDEVLVELSAIRASNPFEEYARIDFRRLSEDYRSAVALARALLDGDVPGLFAGSMRGRTQILAMAPLFDGFISRLTREAARQLGLDGREKVKGRFLASWSDGPYAGRDLVEIIPDAEVAAGGATTPVAVVDAKWKSLRPDRVGRDIDAGDVHQMVAYGVRLSCSRALLVYPSMTSYDAPTPVTHMKAGGAAASVDVGILEVPLLWDRIAQPVIRLGDALAEMIQ